MVTIHDPGLVALPLSVQAQIEKKLDGLQPVTHERLLKGTNDTSSWLMYGGSYQGWRFSPLKDITRQNGQETCSSVDLAKLALLDSWKPRRWSPMASSTSPAAYNNLFALNAETGETLWTYAHPLPRRHAGLLWPHQPRGGHR